MAFAHGKVLLFGEHAVVYGHPAVAFGLPRGVTGSVDPNGAPGVTVAAWGLDAGLADGSKVGRAFEALCRMLPPGVSPRRVVLEADLPAGAGLGSSAAMAVASVRALAEYAAISLSDEDLATAAMASERIFHGTPSGLDHTVAMTGGLIRFERGTPPRVTPLRAGAPFDLVVAQVSDGADTGRMVAGVAAQRDRLGSVAAGVHEQIARAVAAAEASLLAGDLVTLGELMSLNHGLLCALGVSTTELDAACHRARAAGALGAKLTGAGGGGCVVACTPPGGGVGVAAALRVTGRLCFVTTVPEAA